MGLEKYFTVYLCSCFKFILGPVMGVSFGFHPFIVWFLTVAGMMTSVCIITLSGLRLRSFLRKTFKSKRLFTRRSRFIVKVKQRRGLEGIAFFTPLLFSPIVGTLIALAIGAKPKPLILNMLIWASIWSFVFSFSFHFFKAELSFLF